MERKLTNISYIEDAQTLETFFKRNYNSTKFVVVSFLDDGDRVGSYISDGLNDMEMTYIIQCMKDRREVLFNND